MTTIKLLLLTIFAIYLCALALLLNSAFSSMHSKTTFSTTLPDASADQSNYDEPQNNENKRLDNTLRQELEEVYVPRPQREFLAKTRSKPAISRKTNPFYILGAYPEITSQYQKLQFDKQSLNIIKDQDYCDQVDFYNLDDPSQMLTKMHFWTDFPRNQLPAMVMKGFGDVVLGRPTRQQGYGINGESYHLPKQITNFFTEYGFMHQFNKIGTHFACATQMYGRIPGQEIVTTKDALADKISVYAKQYENKEQCFDQKSLFPKTYRLYDEKECKAFFTLINSASYKASLKEEPIQYLIKVGHGSHKSQGVFLLDAEETQSINAQYKNGKKCGVEKESLLAQTYVANPLLLDLDNKFDFRVYMLIASTNPLIVYYHDGFVKTSLLPYEKKSTEKGAHITNTYLANLKIEELKKRNETINGMTPEELKNYILWNFDRLQAYLLESGKVKDPNWLDNYLRPAFFKAFIHLMRMTKDHFWKQSNVYALHGVDFMLDDQMNLWFIESNTSPLLSGTSIAYMYRQVLTSQFEIQYAYFRSRMSRVLEVIREFQEEYPNGTENVKNLGKWKARYAEAVKNRIEPEFKISKNNTFRLVIDENLPGTKAYLDYIPAECL